MDIAIGLNDFFSQIDFKFSKPQLKVLPHLIMAAINAENITNLDLAKNYIDDSLLTNHSSIEKKIWRFLNNHKFDGIKFFKAVVKKIIKKIGALKHNKLVVILDHMYTNDDFVTLMFTLKIGKQSIPIHFINDKDKRSGHYDINDDDRKFLFSQKVIIEAIDYVIDLLSYINAPITFLGDRWFCNLALMLYIIKIFQLANTILNAIYQLAEVIKAMIHGLFYLILNLIKLSVNIHIVLVVLKCFLNLKNPMVSI